MCVGTSGASCYMNKMDYDQDGWHNNDGWFNCQLFIEESKLYVQSTYGYLQNWGEQGMRLIESAEYPLCDQKRVKPSAQLW